MLHRSVASRLVSFRTGVLRPPRRPFVLGSASDRAVLNARARQPLHSSNYTVYFALAALCAAGSGVYLFRSQFSEHSVPPPRIQSLLESQESTDMTASALPGRPGNLTDEQEILLKDMWKTTLRTFGVELGEANGAPDDAPEEAEVEEEEKGRRWGLFGRKKEKSAKETKGDKTTATAGKSSTEDDKYGQTKEYLAALKKHSPEELRTAFWEFVKGDHPDGLLLRFLRARKWDIEKALVMMISTLNWRLNEVHVDSDIMINGEEYALQNEKSSDTKLKKSGNDFLEQLRLGKGYLHGTDNEGRPMCAIRVRLHHAGDQAQPNIERFTVYLIETARLTLVPPVDTATLIFDMTGFTLANLDYPPIKFMIRCFEANYPESLGAVLIHKAPWVFQGIWKIIRGWLDPVVASKVHFTNNLKDMEAFIAAEKIPKEFGGKEDWEYSYPEPEAGENDKMKDEETRDKLKAERKEMVREYEDATKAWIKGDTSSKEKRVEIAAKLKQNYWQLDPYVRARSMYDRNGLIGPGGVITPYDGKSYAPDGEKADSSKASSFKSAEEEAPAESTSKGEPAAAGKDADEAK